MKAIEEETVRGGSKKRAVYNGYDIVFDHVGFSYKDGEQVLRGRVVHRKTGGEVSGS